MNEARAEVFSRYSRLSPEIVDAVFRRHGVLAAAVLGDGDHGEHFGAGLTEREVRYLRDEEWARTAEPQLSQQRGRLWNCSTPRSSTSLRITARTHRRLMPIGVVGSIYSSCRRCAGVGRPKS